MTKTTKKNIQERLNTWTEGYPTTTDCGSTYITITKEEFESLKDLLLSNLSADLKKRLDIWTNTATGRTIIGTYCYRYLEMAITE